MPEPIHAQLPTLLEPEVVVQPHSASQEVSYNEAIEGKSYIFLVINCTKTEKSLIFRIFNKYLFFEKTKILMCDFKVKYVRRTLIFHLKGFKSKRFTSTKEGIPTIYNYLFFICNL